MYHNIKIVDGLTQSLDIIGKPYLLSNTPLQYRGPNRKIFRIFDDSKALLSMSQKKTSLHMLASRNIFTVSPEEPVLSRSQCEGIVSNIEKLTQELRLVSEDAKQLENLPNTVDNNPTNQKMKAPVKTSPTLIFQDQQFTESLWQRISDSFKSHHNHSKLFMPGCGQQCGEACWKFSGIHDAFTFHTYDTMKEEVDFMEPHLDAQFCPNSHNRSLFTILLFLDEAPNCQLTFFLPTDKEKLQKAAATSNKMNAYRQYKRIDGKFKTVLYTPKKAGELVIFKQDTFFYHGIRVNDPAQCRFLRFDVMLESKDVERTLNDSTINFEHCHDRDFAYYSNTLIYDKNAILQRHLFVRYFGDEGKTKKNGSKLSLVDQSYFCKDLLKPHSMLSEDIWFLIIEYLGDYENISNLVKAFPTLNQIFARYLRKFCHVPRIVSKSGIFTEFAFTNSDKSNLKRLSAVASVYAFALLGIDDISDFGKSSYFVMLDSNKGIVREISLEEFLFLVYNCDEIELHHNHVFRVKQQGKERKPLHDLFWSVDRRLMALYFDINFFGVDLESERRCSFEITRFSPEYNPSDYHDYGELNLYESRKNAIGLKSRTDYVRRMLTAWDRCSRLATDRARERLAIRSETKTKTNVVQGTRSSGANGDPSNLQSCSSQENEDKLNDQIQDFILSRGFDTRDMHLPYPELLRNIGLCWKSLLLSQSCVIVRRLQSEQVLMDQFENCTCNSNENRKISSKLTDNCSTHTFNHLVLNRDIQKFCFNLERDTPPEANLLGEDSKCSFSCLNRRRLVNRIKSIVPDLKDLKVVGFSSFPFFLFNPTPKMESPPKIRPSSDEKQPPCNKCFPFDFKVTEFVDISNNLSIDHTHAINIESDDGFRVFTAYGQVLCL